MTTQSDTIVKAVINQLHSAISSRTEAIARLEDSFNAMPQDQQAILFASHKNCLIREDKALSEDKARLSLLLEIQGR